MNKQWKLTAGAAALAMSFGAQAGVVDLFTTQQLVAKDYVNGAFNSTDSNFGQSAGPADATILGGYRDLVVSNISGGDVVTGSSINVIGGQLKFSTDTGATGQGQVQWDGDDSAGNVFDIATSGLGGFDLTFGGTLTDFELTTVFSDQGWVFDITMYSSAVNWTRVSLDANSVGPTGDFASPHVSYIPFSAFTTGALCGTYGAAPGVNAIICNGTGADATSIGALVATLNVGDPLAPNGSGSAPQSRTISVDLQLDSVRTVPEPGVLALMGMGLMAAGFAGRRRKSQA